MANGNTHRALAAIAVGGTWMYRESLDNQRSSKPLVAAVAASFLGTLPDRIEPAYSPHHRQFFHSIAFAVFVGSIAWKALEWRPDCDWQKAVRLAIVVASGAYLSHLAVDALSKRSLPFVGKW